MKGTPPPVPEGADAVAPGSGGQVGCFFVGMHNPEGAGEREPLGLAVAEGCGVATLVPHSDGKPCSPGIGAIGNFTFEASTLGALMFPEAPH